MQKTIKYTGIAVAISVATLAIVAIASPANAQDAAAADKQLKAISSRCIPAQSKIRTLQQQVTEAGNRRNSLYAQVDARLWVAIGKIKLGDKDTADLELARTELYAKTSKYAQLNQVYIQTLGEVALVDCKADPSAFKTVLDLARTQNTELRALNTETRDYINNDIKSAISAFTETNEE